MNDELWRCPVLDEDGRVPFGIALTIFPDFTLELVWGYVSGRRKVLDGRGTNIVLRKVEFLGRVLVQR